MLNVGSFDSKNRFVEALRTAYGGGTFLLGSKVTSAIVHDFAVHLKRDHECKDDQREFKEADVIGHQGGTYWLLSSKVSLV